MIHVLTPSIHTYLVYNTLTRNMRDVGILTFHRNYPYSYGQSRTLYNKKGTEQVQAPRPRPIVATSTST